LATAPEMPRLMAHGRASAVRKLPPRLLSGYDYSTRS
jgi:hypothetical protein